LERLPRATKNNLKKEQVTLGTKPFEMIQKNTHTNQQKDQKQRKERQMKETKFHQ